MEGRDLSWGEDKKTPKGMEVVTRQSKFTIYDIA
jgi:hypothetical protein